MIPHPSEWGLVADDLTGACLVGGKLANAGVPVLIATGARHALPEPRSDWLPHGGVVGVNTDSRLADPPQAASRVADAIRWLQRLGRKRSFKFVDSSLRGNVGVELEAALLHAAPRRALVVPGTPTVGRTVRHGRLSCFGVPAHLSPLIADDPLTPIFTDDVVDLFSAHSQLSYVSLPRSEPLASGCGASRREEGRDLVERIGRALEADSVPILDAEDSDAIVSAFDALVRHDRLDDVGVLCGSVGLADAWVGWLASAGHPEPAMRNRPPMDGAPLVLIVCGSRSSVSEGQVAHLVAAGIPSVPCLSPAERGLRPDDEILRDAWRALSTSGGAVLVPGAEAGPSGPAPRDRHVAHATPVGIATALARATRSIVTEARARGRSVVLLLVGGMTAGAIMEELEVDFLRPAEEHDYVVLSEAMTREGVPMAIATKGGSAGNPNALTLAVARWLG